MNDNKSKCTQSEDHCGCWEEGKNCCFCSVGGKVVFAKREVKHLQENPDAIRIVADYHDINETMAEAMGATNSTRHHRDRRIQLNHAADKLEESLENGK